MISSNRYTSPTGAKVPVGLSPDLFVGLAIAGFGIALILWIIPAQVSDRGSFGLPPSLAPRSLAWLMVLLGTVLAVQNARPRPKSDADLTLLDVGYLAACIIAVGLMLMGMQFVGGWIGRPFSGFLIAAPLGLIAFTALHGRAPLWVFAFNSIAIPLVVYAAFWWGLRLPLP